MNNSEQDPANHDSSGSQPSEDEVWQDLVTRLENTESLSDHPGGTQASGHDIPDSLDDASPPSGATPRGGPPSSSDPTPDQAPPAGQPPPGHQPSLPGQQPPEPEPPPRATEGPGGQPGGPRDYIPPEEDDRFIPEDPPTLAGAEPLVVLAWIGAIGGPLALLLSAFIFRSIPMLAVVGIVVVFIASVVFLLMRLPTDRGNDHDDGAVV